MYTVSELYVTLKCPSWKTLSADTGFEKQIAAMERALCWCPVKAHFYNSLHSFQDLKIYY